MANSVSNAIFLPIKILAPLFFITTLNFANSDTLNYYFLLYQQTTYLENALMPGSWWSNPASTAEIERKTAQTVDVTPLGNVLTIASAKFLMPVTSRFCGGIGIMGVGQGNSSSQNLNATGSGATFQSQSSFLTPACNFRAQLNSGTAEESVCFLISGRNSCRAQWILVQRIPIIPII